MKNTREVYIGDGRSNPFNTGEMDFKNPIEKPRQKARRHLYEAKLTSASYNIYKQRINKWKHNGN